MKYTIDVPEPPVDHDVYVNASGEYRPCAYAFIGGQWTVASASNVLLLACPRYTLHDWANNVTEFKVLARMLPSSANGCTMRHFGGSDWVLSLLPWVPLKLEVPPGDREPRTLALLNGEWADGGPHVKAELVDRPSAEKMISELGGSTLMRCSVCEGVSNITNFGTPFLCVACEHAGAGSKTGVAHGP